VTGLLWKALAEGSGVTFDEFMKPADDGELPH
jgi:hypothetical protein